MALLSHEAICEIGDCLDGALRARRTAAYTAAAYKFPLERAALSSEFCAAWPAAKTALSTIAALLGLIPGLGAGPILCALVALADQTYEGVCRPRA